MATTNTTGNGSSEGTSDDTSNSAPLTNPETTKNKSNTKNKKSENISDKKTIKTNILIPRKKATRKQPDPTKSNTQILSSAPAYGQGIDAHPFARGSVIEVLYGPFPAKYSTKTDGVDEDEEDYEEEEEEEDMVEEEEANNQNKKTEKSSSKQPPKPPDIRLADIIDRAPSTSTPNHHLPSHRWKYYIHYRNHNRRMDEWITDPRRIISPPSVGNAKVRAMKKKEKKKREIEELMALEERENKQMRKNVKIVDGIAVDGSLLDQQQGDAPIPSPGSRPVSQRASSRRASAAITSAVQGNTLSPTVPATSDGTTAGNAGPGPSGSTSKSETDPNSGGIGGGAADDDAFTTRRRRKSSRSSSQLNADNNEQDNNKTLSRSASVVLLPEEEQMKDKIVTVAAQELDEHEGLDEASLREHEEVTKVKNVAEVQLGQYRMDTWYYSPIPKDMLRGHNNMIDVLYVCEFTLNFFPRKEELERFQQKELHKMKRHPPGNEIYRNGRLSMFEVDGLEERLYCQNLCYIAKLFLDHKTLYFDVDPFLFYVLCEIDERGFHPVGYYSKEKYSDVGYNLACILSFPCHQRKGYGRFLIDFSYELSKKEEKVGSPEKPMSDLGQMAYKPYWTSTIVDFLLNESDDTSMSIMEISKRTSIMAEDIIFTLNMLGLLKYINGVYFITAEQRLLQELAKKHPVKDPRVDPSKLHWTPYVTDIKRDKFSIHSKKPSVDEEEFRGNGGF